MTAQNLYEMGTPLRVAYCHPDLGLGGRLPGHVRFPCLDGMVNFCVLRQEQKGLS